MTKFTSKLAKKIVASILIASNLAYPVLASAGQYQYRAATRELKVVGSSNTGGAGQSVSLAIDASAKTFGNVPIGNTAYLTFALTNAGSAPAPLQATGVAPDVVFGGDCPATLPAGGTCSLALSFTPSTTTPLSAVFGVQSGSSSVSFTVSGTGVAQPEFTLSQSDLSFGVVSVGSSAIQETVVSNTGNVPLYAPTVSTTGTAFIQADTCTEPLPVGATCSVQVTFAPSIEQPYAGALNIGFSGQSDKVVSLSGTGKGTPVLTFSGAGVSGTNITVPGVQNSMSVVPVTLTNTGNGALYFQPGVSLTGDSAFSVVGVTCPVGIFAPGASCQASVQFTPGSLQTYTATLSFTSDLGTHALNLTGVAANNPSITTSVASLSFDDTLAGTSSVTKSFTLTNNGNTSLTTLAVTTPSAEFTSSNNCPTVFGTGAVCTVNVTFVPTAGVPSSGNISLNYGSAPTWGVSVAGQGLAPELSSNVSTQAFGDVAIGASSTKTFVITNTGNSPATISYPTISSPFSLDSSSTCSATPLAAGTSCNYVIKFTPELPTGAASGTATLTASGSSVALSFNGNVVGSPAVSLSTSALAFGSVTAFSSNVLSFVVDNTGTAAAQAPVITTSGATYSAAHNCASTLAPGSSCTVNVTFVPAGALTYTGSVSVAFTGVATQTVSLTGTGLSAVIAADATLIDYGSIPLGASRARTYTLLNTGTSAGALSYSTLPSTVVRSGTCAASVASKSSCTVILTITPTAVGALTGALVVTSGSSNLNLGYAASGVTDATAQIENAQAQVVSSVQFLDTASPATTTRRLVIRNVGNSALTFGSTPVTSSGTPFVVGTTTCANATLPSSATCYVDITFAPSADQPYSGSLFVNNTSGVPTSAVTLSGNGVPLRVTDMVTSEDSTSVFIRKSDGNWYAAGDNTYSQLGLGNGAATRTWTLVPALAGAVAVKSAYFTTYAQYYDGSWKGVGRNESGQLGRGNITQQATLVDLPALQGASDLFVTGYSGGSAYARFSDGSWKVAGYNQQGTLGVGTTTSVTTFTTSPSLQNALSVTIFGGESYARFSSGAWSYAGTGFSTFTNQPAISGATKIVSSHATTNILMSDGTVRATGTNSYGQYGNGTTFGSTAGVYVTVPGLSDIVDLTSNWGAVMALKNTGEVFTAGLGNNGATGSGVTTNKTVYTAISGVTASAIVALNGTSYIRTTSGSWVGAGLNSNGQLGLGDTTNRLTFTPIPALGTNIAELIGGWRAATVLAKPVGSSQVYGFGNNLSGQFGQGTAGNVPTPTLLTLP
jgi:alpha-tubulin suppressor-like RCC1 family protein